MQYEARCTYGVKYGIIVMLQLAKIKMTFVFVCQCKNY